MTPLKAVCYIFFTGLNFAVYVYFILAAFQNFLRFSKGKTIFFVFWAFVIGSVLEVLVFEKDSPFHQYLLAGKVLITLVTVIMAVGLVLKKPLQVGFGMFMALTIQNSIITAAEMLTALSPLPVLVAEFPNFNYLLYTIFVLALFVPLLYYLFCRLLRRVMELGMDLRQWGILLLLPFLYFIYEMRSLHCGAVRPPVTWGSLFDLLLLNLCAVVAYSSVMKMFTYSHDKSEAANRAAAMAQQLSLQQAHYEMLQSHIAENDRLLHDWRHHMIALRDSAERGDVAEIRSYLNQLGETYEPQEMPPICARASVEVILRHYLGLARENGIEVTHKVLLPASCPGSDTNLCVVFGNLAENALEACLRQTGGRRYILISAQCVGKNMLAVRVKNSYDTPVSEVGGVYQSTKHPGVGLGLASVAEIAGQNGGTFHVTARDGVFSVEVLLIS